MTDGPAIIRLTRALPSSASEVAVALAGVDWNWLAVDAGRHGLSGVVNRLVADGLPVPSRVAARVRADSFALAASSLRAKARFFRALKARAGRGVRRFCSRATGWRRGC